MAKRTFLSATHRATRQIGLYFEQKGAGGGLSPHEGHLLTYLRSYAPAPVGELVRVFGVKASTMTGTLDRLESLGFVERRANPDDRRSFQVVLTPRGAPHAEAMQKFVEQAEREIARRVSDREVDGFFAVMRAIEEMSGVTVRPPREESRAAGPPARSADGGSAVRHAPSEPETAIEPPNDDMEID